MKPELDLSLYLCTDRNLMRAGSLEEAVTLAVEGGCTVVQLREKDCSSLEFYRIAQSLRTLTRALGVPLILNDRVDIALAVDADGVHLGQSDLPAGIARRLIGNKLLGVSAASLAEARRARADTADYIGVGALFPTGTKEDAKAVSLEELKTIREQVDLPLVAIGGINLETVGRLKGTGADGIAVISAILAQPDIRGAAEGLKRAFLSVRGDFNAGLQGGSF